MMEFWLGIAIGNIVVNYFFATRNIYKLERYILKLEKRIKELEAKLQ